MKSKTEQSHTLSEALDRMKAKTLAAEARGDKTVSIGAEDVANLDEAAFRCNDYVRMDNLQFDAFNRGVARERISGMQTHAKWARERGHDDFADYLDGLATAWIGRSK